MWCRRSSNFPSDLRHDRVEQPDARSGTRHRHTERRRDRAPAPPRRDARRALQPHDAARAPAGRSRRRRAAGISALRRSAVCSLRRGKLRRCTCRCWAGSRWRCSVPGRRAATATSIRRRCRCPRARRAPPMAGTWRSAIPTAASAATPTVSTKSRPSWRRPNCSRAAWSCRIRAAIRVLSTNLTPDPTGIRQWTLAQFDSALTTGIAPGGWRDPIPDADPTLHRRRRDGGDLSLPAECAAGESHAASSPAAADPEPQRAARGGLPGAGLRALPRPGRSIS